MSDLISRQAAIEETWKEPTYLDPVNVLTEMRDRINGIPSADVVEVVRCKDCTRQCICYHSDDYFCSEGERIKRRTNG